jgi:hypothetical protein
VTPAVVDGYRFKPDDLDKVGRPPGISAFMRIKNGAAFLEAAIRSHMPYVDEIVAVYNQCTDATPDILARLADEFGEHRLRVFHYLPAVFPPGSDGHASTPADAPASLVNYYNFALSCTRFAVATKLDDDHLAMPAELDRLTREIRAGAYRDEVACFSGPNLARGADGTVGVLAREPFSGGGDIGFFPVSRDTYFTHDPRFERFHRGHLKRRFAGFVYWHLKYMKPDLGFGNYALGENPDSRYARKRERLLADMRVVPVGAVGGLATARDRVLVTARRLGLPIGEKAALIADRWRAAAALPPITPLEGIA